MTVCASVDLILHQGPGAEREPVVRPGRLTSRHLKTPEPADETTVSRLYCVKWIHHCVVLSSAIQYPCVMIYQVVQALTECRAYNSSDCPSANSILDTVTSNSQSSFSRL
jgi:hypothetical protein